MTSVLQDLWPDDIRSQEIASPEQILRWQAEALVRRTGGLVFAEVVRSETNDRVVLGLEAEAAGVHERARLLEVHQLPVHPYPAAIVPPEERLPDFLKKSRYVPAPVSPLSPLKALAELEKGRNVENKWVASTPIEFGNKIKDALSLPSVKSVVVSLMTRAKESAQPEDVEAGE